MTKMTRGLWLTAAASMAFAMGCGGGGGEPTDAGSGCTSDSACGAGKVCHPTLKACVTSCTGSVDCPQSAKTCARYDGTPGSAATPGFCQCSTDQFCSDSTANQVCNLATKQCSDKCTSDLSCPSGSKCSLSTGVCSALSSTDAGTDGGTDAGTDGGTDAGMTDAGVTCDSNTQPGACGYGGYCPTTNVCELAPVGTCSNVTSHPAWSTSSTGPVIYYVVDEQVDDVTKCDQATAAKNPFTVTLYAYRTSGTFPAMKSDLPGFFYYTTAGSAVDIPLNLLQQSNYMLYQNNQVMTAKFTLCSASTQSIVAGFGFTNGNAVCATLTR